MPVACQSRGVTEPQRDGDRRRRWRGLPSPGGRWRGAPDEGRCLPAFHHRNQRTSSVIARRRLRRRGNPQPPSIFSFPGRNRSVPTAGRFLCRQRKRRKKPLKGTCSETVPLRIPPFGQRGNLRVPPLDFLSRGTGDGGRRTKDGGPLISQPLGLTASPRGSRTCGGKGDEGQVNDTQ